MKALKVLFKCLLNFKLIDKVHEVTVKFIVNFKLKDKDQKVSIELKL